MASHEPFGHLQHKLWSKERVGSQISNLTPDHGKSRIDLTPVCTSGVRHTVWKLLRRATSFLQTSSQSEVWAESYELPKSRKSNPWQFRDSPLGVSRLKVIWMRVWWSNTKNTIWGKVVIFPKSGSWWIKWVRVARGLSQHQECFRRWTNQLVVGFDAGPSN